MNNILQFEFKILCKIVVILDNISVLIQIPQFTQREIESTAPLETAQNRNTKKNLRRVVVNQVNVANAKNI